MTTHEIEHVRIIGFFHKKWPRRGSEPKSEGHMLVARTLVLSILPDSTYHLIIIVLNSVRCIM
jgi:hypothetical protein